MPKKSNSTQLGKKIMDKLMQRNQGLSIDLGRTLPETKVWLNGEELPITNIMIETSAERGTMVKLEFYLTDNIHHASLEGKFNPTHSRVIKEDL